MFTRECMYLKHINNIFEVCMYVLLALRRMSWLTVCWTRLYSMIKVARGPKGPIIWYLKMFFLFSLLCVSQVLKSERPRSRTTNEQTAVMLPLSLKLHAASFTSPSRAAATKCLQALHVVKLVNSPFKRKLKKWGEACWETDIKSCC